MERSIETIWKNGFNEGMLIPRLNKLYQQKSTLLVEKVKRTYRNDNAVVPLMAAALAVAGYFTGYLYTGLYLLAMLMGLFVLNRQQLSKLEGVQLTDDLYVYLTTYRNTVQGIVRFYTRLMALGLPVAALPVLYVVLDQLQPGLWAELYAKSAWSATGIMLLLALVFSGFGVAVYRMSTQALYGKQLEKLNEMISDLEELQEADQ